jgi:hypothetical protein
MIALFAGGSKRLLYTGFHPVSDIADYVSLYAKLPNFEHNVSALAPESVGITSSLPPVAGVRADRAPKPRCPDTGRP